MPKAELLSSEDGAGVCANGADGDLCSASEMSTCVTASSPDLEKSRLNQGDLIREVTDTDTPVSRKGPKPTPTQEHTVRSISRNLTLLLESNVIGKALERVRTEDLNDRDLELDVGDLIKDAPGMRSAVQTEECPTTPERVADQQLVFEEQLVAERSKVERLTAERAAAERLASERQVAERRAAERLAQAETREAACEKQIAEERRQAADLVAQLEKVQREVDVKRQEADNAGEMIKELRAREAQMLAHAQSLESLNKDAKDQVEALQFQQKLIEVDCSHNKAQLVAALERQKILEEELRLLKEPVPVAVPMAALQVGRNRPPALLARHGMASRAAFEQTNNNRHVVEGSGSPKKQPPAADSSRGSLFGCCSVSMSDKSSSVSR